MNTTFNNQKTMVKNFALSSLSLALAPLLLTAAHAAQADTLPTAQLPAINITATTENSIDSSLPNAKTMNLEKQNDTSIVDVSSALQNDTSIDLNLDGNGNTRYINIRGIGANNTEVKIDGIKKPQNFSYAHGIYNSGELNPYEIDTIKQIDIVKGRNSPKQGGGALAGSVNMRTYRPSDFIDDENRKYASLQSSYADKNDSWGNTLTVAAGNDKVSGMVMYTKRDSHEYENTGNDEDKTQRNNIEYEQDNILVKGEMDVTGGKLIATAERFDQKRKTEYRYYQREGKDEPIKRSRYSVEGEFQDVLGTDALNFLLGYQKIDNTSQGQYIGLFKNDLFTAGVDGEKHIETGTLNQHLLLGLGYESSEFDFKRQSKVDGSYNRRIPITKRDTTYIYGKDHIGFNNGFVLSPGVRVEHEKHSSKSDDIYENNPAVQFQNFIPKGSKTKVLPSLGASMPINDKTTVYANYAKGSKSADDINFTSFYHPPPRTFANIPNPDLKDETSQNFELGFIYEPNDMRSLRVNGFYTKYDDFVVKKFLDEYNGNKGDFNIPYNLDDAKTYGIEVDSSLAINDALTANLGATWMKGEKGSDGKEDKPLINISPLVTNFNLSYSPSEDWGSSLRLRAASKGADPENDTKFRTPGYVLADLTGWWKPMESLTLSGGVYNVFDKTYWLAAEVNGNSKQGYYGPVNFEKYSRPGRNFGIKAKYEF
ncbi:TonB-dependent receptor [Psychrobacter sp. HD31]|uniref:TonB-dependent receptor domain-containing protein n=1 Tax=Psychrobacter sp. HD31 TaxID=3112003 RepID=UPI003DA3F67F